MKSKVASDDYVSIKDLANRLGMDRSHARRYVMKLGPPQAADTWFGKPVDGLRDECRG